MLPEKLGWADKQQGEPSDKPVNQKLTFTEANDLRDSHNDIIDFLPIHLYSDSNGYITAPSVLNPDLSLVGVHIGSIQGVGAVLYFEYNATKNPVLNGSTYGKDYEEDTIMEATTHTPKKFLANSVFLLNKR